MLAGLVAPTRSLLRLLTECSRKVQTVRERYRTFIGEDVREAHGITLLREWLSPKQQAQFDAFRWFDVIGCDSGKRYRIRYGSAVNVHEIDEAGHPVVGWCFVPFGHLVPGDVMLAQKVALETNEHAALEVAHRFPVQLSGAELDHPRRRAY
jgi:hypothetical protein